MSLNGHGRCPPWYFLPSAFTINSLWSFKLINTASNSPRLAEIFTHLNDLNFNSPVSEATTLPTMSKGAEYLLISLYIETTKRHNVFFKACVILLCVYRYIRFLCQNYPWWLKMDIFENFICFNSQYRPLFRLFSSISPSNNNYSFKNFNTLIRPTRCCCCCEQKLQNRISKNSDFRKSLFWIDFEPKISFACIKKSSLLSAMTVWPDAEIKKSNFFHKLPKVLPKQFLPQMRCVSK